MSDPQTSPDPAGQEPPAAPVSAPPQAGDDQPDSAYEAKLWRENAKWRTKLREAEERLAAYEQRASQEDKRTIELETLRKQTADFEQVLATHRQALRAERARVAVMTEATAQGLDPALAAELLTPDKLEYDDDDRPKGIRPALKTLLERFPALQPSQARSANPARGAQAAETDEARRRRIYGGGVNPFDPAVALSLGGGVIYPPKEER